MKKSTKGILIAVISLIIIGSSLLLAFFLSNNEPKPLEDGHLLYEAIVNTSAQTEELNYRLRETRTMSDGDQTQTEQVSQTIRTNKLSRRYHTEQTLTIGEHQICASELYTDGKLYQAVEGGRFVYDLPADQAYDRVVPMLLLTPERYSSVQSQELTNGILVRYTEATAFEPWFSAAGATFLRGSGAVILDASGAFKMCSYELVYRIDEKIFHHGFRTEILPNDEPDFPVPDAEDTYTAIEHPDAVPALERASGYLLSAGSVDTTYTDRILCGVFGDLRQQTIRLRTNSAGSWAAQLETEITVTNESQTAAPSTLSQTERFENGTYTISTNGGPSTQDQTVTQSVMQDHCRDILVGTIPLPHQIRGVTVTQSASIYTYTYELTESFARSLAEEACDLLYGSTDLLAVHEDSYSTEYARCQLVIDSTTGIPLSSVLEYRGNYIIDTVTYALEYCAEQSYAG